MIILSIVQKCILDGSLFLYSLIMNDMIQGEFNCFVLVYSPLKYLVLVFPFLYSFSIVKLKL